MTQDYLAGALTFISAVVLSTATAALVIGALARKLLADNTYVGLIDLTKEAMRHLATKNFNEGDPIIGRIAATGMSRAMVEQAYKRPEPEVPEPEGPRTPEYSEEGAPQFHPVGP